MAPAFYCGRDKEKAMRIDFRMALSVSVWLIVKSQFSTDNYPWLELLNQHLDFVLVLHVRQNLSKLGFALT